MATASALCAQLIPSSADPLNGWGTLILQGGAFMLLVYIVVWMYPKAAKEQREERETRDQLFADLVKGLQDKDEKRSDKILEALYEQTGTLSTAFRDAAGDMKTAVAGICRGRISP
jgi:hypothetical protein